MNQRKEVSNKASAVEARVSAPLNFSQAVEVIVDFWRTERKQAAEGKQNVNRMIPLLTGKPGNGKSTAVRRALERIQQEDPEGKWVLWDLSLAQSDPTDFGAPAIQQVDELLSVTAKCPPLWAPILNHPESAQGHKVLIFLDELRQATELMQNIGSNIMDGRIGDYHLDPARTMIVAASNRLEDFAAVFESPSNVQNRLCELPIEITFDEWIEWAISEQLHPSVLSFLQHNTQFFNQDPPKTSHGFGTPRSWHNLSMFMTSCNLQMDADFVLLPVMTGFVGPTAAILLYQHAYELFETNGARRILAGDYTNIPTAGDQLIGTIMEGMMLLNAEIERAMDMTPHAANSDRPWLVDVVQTLGTGGVGHINNFYRWLGTALTDKAMAVYAITLRSKRVRQYFTEALMNHPDLQPATHVMKQAIEAMNGHSTAAANQGPVRTG
jgi:hypothetical protein